MSWKNHFSEEEPSPFLWTRIEQKIRNLEHDKAPTSWVLASLSLVALLISLNTFAVTKNDKSSNETENLATEMKMISNYHLYQE